MTLRHVFGIDDEAALTAALLHDVLEDTTADYDDLAEEFGDEVAQIVAALSKDPRMPEPKREPAYDQQLERAAWQAKAIKLADVYDNYCDASADSQKKLAEKVRRAIAIAAAEPRLKKAVAIVGELIS
jgi:guanosine-3',5'-bis(diphosphate) 3'-pyrophosphohydrolase